MAKKADHENIRIFLEKGIDIEGRIIHLCSDIDSLVIGEIIRGIQVMITKNKEPISIFINTFGGCPYSSFALYDFIRSLEEIIFKTYNIGSCMSGGTVIFMAGDERYMYPNAVFMFHTVSSFSEGLLHQLIDESDECKRLYKQMCYLYGSHGKLTAKEWTSKLRYHNVYIRADDARELEIINDVIKY